MRAHGVLTNAATVTGRSVAASEALEMGLANRVVKRGTALAAAEELARRIASLCVVARVRVVFGEGCVLR